MEKPRIIVETDVEVSVDKAWELWTREEHICRWNAASEEWQTTEAKNELKEGGEFCYRMEAKDGSVAFDYKGTYDEVIPEERIVYTLEDGRKVLIIFDGDEVETGIVEQFEADETASLEQQQQGWQAILENFKRYAEENS